VKSVNKTLNKYSCITGGKKENMNDFQCNRMLIYNLKSNIICNLISGTTVVLTSLCVRFLFFFGEWVQYHNPVPNTPKSTYTHIRVRTSAGQGSLHCLLGGGGWELACDIEPCTQKKHTHTKLSKNLCSTRNQVAKLFITRKFLTSACKMLTFHLHLSNISLKCTAHCEP
jgi:hypothetical protein